MRPGVPLVAWALASVLCLGCSGADPQSGVTAYFRLQGAQPVAGEIDQSDNATVPEIHRIDSQNNTVYPGIVGKSIGGSAGPNTVAVLIGLVGDSAHWVLPVQALDQANPGDFIFSGKASFSPTIPLGAATLVYRAVDAKGDIGPIAKQALEIQGAAAKGAFIISLDWDTEADLDLRVTAPDATGKEVEIWSRKQSSLIPPGPMDPPVTQADIDAAGRLDVDSNNQCVIDGRRQENIYWTTMPPSTGALYTVRVDAFSMCGEVLAHWRVRVLMDGQVVQQAEGQMGDTDTRFDHGPGGGLLALQFTY